MSKEGGKDIPPLFDFVIQLQFTNTIGILTIFSYLVFLSANPICAFISAIAFWIYMVNVPSAVDFFDIFIVSHPSVINCSMLCLKRGTHFLSFLFALIATVRVGTVEELLR